MIQDKIYSYFERNENLKVLFIFDSLNSIASELRPLSWRKEFRYIEFDGGWFKTKYALENEWKDDKVILVFDQISPVSSPTNMLKFPLLDILCANMEYKNDDYGAFLQLHNLPAKFNDFIHKHINELQLEKFNCILELYYNANSFSRDIGFRGLMTGYLGEKCLLDWDDILIKLFIISLPDQKKKYTSFYNSLNKGKDSSLELQKVFMDYFGVNYDPNSEIKLKEAAESLKYNAITQSLAMNDEDNYKRLKISNSLSLDKINKLLDRATHQSKAKREQFFKAFDKLSSKINVSEIIKVYGIDADYFYLPDALCWEIIKIVFDTQITKESQNSIDKLHELLLKKEEDEKICDVLSYGLEIAGYYEKANSLGSLTYNKPNDYINKYVSEFYLLDTYYRKSLEYYNKITDSIPVKNFIDGIKQKLDVDYAQLCNIFNLEWLTCLKEKGGGFNAIDFLFKQQNFYEKEKISDKQVIIISDAFRYEVAAELIQYLSRERHLVTIDAYLAMLPTETKFCKPALLPNHSLQLYKNGNDVNMKVDDKVLNTIDKRSAHLKCYNKDAVCVDYADVANGTFASNRELFKKPLVYIFHNTIDEVGHSNNPVEVIAACHRTVEQLSKLVPSLHATYNVTNVVVTSDHGFLYNDMEFKEKDKQKVEDNDVVEKKSRYYLTKSNTHVQGIVKFSLSDVSGIKNNNLYVAVPEGTNRLAAQGGGYNFTHGGASLQELIIPVIRSKNQKKNKKPKVGLALVSHNLYLVSSRLKFKIMQSEVVDMDIQERTISCALYINDTAVTEKKIIILNSTDADNFNNRIYDVELILNKSTSESIMQLKIFDVGDPLNPLIKENVTNKTLIERDF
ncbi:MAG: PglZ domain-containing protein [Prolixibacteraceae bacterium]|nr:PglZ domain-containing protein [Prolixibacteraceae bacterium]